MLSFNTNYVSKHARTLAIDALRLRLPSESTVSFADSEMILEWVIKLFPDPPIEKETAETLAPAEQGCRLWRRSFFQSNISALLATIVLNGTNLQELSLELANMGREPNFVQLVVCKVAYDFAIGIETSLRIQSLFITASYVDNIIALLPNLRHFELQYTTEDMSLYIYPSKYAA